MKRMVTLVSMLLGNLCCRAQMPPETAEALDSVLKVPQTIELTMSTPQPRLGETFQISLDINPVRAHIFRSALGVIRLASETGTSDADRMVLNVEALHRGKNAIGPLRFMLNGTQYTTGKIRFEVVDPLPKTDSGLWIRKVATSDSTFCLIVEQRFPARSMVTEVSETETRYWSQPSSEDWVQLKMAYTIEGLQGGNVASRSEQKAFTDSRGETRQFMSYYYVARFRVLERGKKITISRDAFENLPRGYRFEPVVVQWR